MMPRMKTKTRKVRNRNIARNKAKAKAKASRKPAKAKSKAARKPGPKSRISKKPLAITRPIATPAVSSDSRLLKMPNRVPGTKSDFNLRFATADDYQLVKTEATSRGMSMNLFVTTAALKAAGKKAETA